MVQMLQLRSANSGVPFVGENDGDTVIWDAAAQLWKTGPGGGGGAVASVFGRAGVVVAVAGDYDSDEVTNVSAVVGVSVSDALDTLAASIALLNRTTAMYEATAETNTVDSTASANLLAITGSAFAERFAGTGWALTAAACVATFTGLANSRFLVRVFATISQTANQNTSFYGAVTVNGALIGAAPGTTFTGGIQADSNADVILAPFEHPLAFECEVQVSTGDTVQAVFSGDNNAEDLTIRRMTMTISPLG
jgi:hypothetical protein